MNFSHYPPFFLIPLLVLLWPFFPQSSFLLSCLLFVCLFLVWAPLGTDSWVLELKDPLPQSSSLPYLSFFTPPFPEGFHLSQSKIYSPHWYKRLFMNWWWRLLQITAGQTSFILEQAISWGSNHSSLAFLITCHLSKLLWFLTEPSISAFRFPEYVQVLICHFNWI